MSSTWTLINPATEEPYRDVTAISEPELAAAVVRARHAQRDWRQPHRGPRPGRRSDGPAFRAQADQVALEITRQMGKPIQQARNEINTMIDRAETMCRLAEAALADEPLAPKDGFHRFIRHEPLGVVLDIAAWNYPLLIAGQRDRARAPRRQRGAREARAPHPALRGHFVSAFAKAGLPAGLIAATAHGPRAGRQGDPLGPGGLRLVHGLGGGRPRDPRHVASRFIDAGLELGGKDPAYVADDANFDFAVENLVDGAFYNAGQSCCGIERIYVARALFDRFVDAYVALVRQYRMGDPEDPATTLGPCAQEKVVATVQTQVAQARAAGARVLTGGAPWKGSRPLLRAHRAGRRQPRMPVMWEESFGPVIGLMPVADDAEAVRLMNDSPYGLTASVWTEDAERAERLMDQVDAGTVYANRCDYLDPLLPWVGVKDSGKGCSLSHLGFRHLTRPKSFHLRTRTA